jgi:hypothetical protein
MKRGFRVSRRLCNVIARRLITDEAISKNLWIPQASEMRLPRSLGFCALKDDGVILRKCPWGAMTVEIN